MSTRSVSGSGRWRVSSMSVSVVGRLAVEARAAGWGGVTAVARQTGVSVPTIRKGIAELEADEHLQLGRVRREGARRKPLTDVDATLLRDSGAARGCRVRWVIRSRSAVDLQERASFGRGVARAGLFGRTSRPSRRCCAHWGTACKRTSRRGRANSTPIVMTQFRHINHVAKAAVAAGLPVISVDAKKKELVWDFEERWP